MENTKTDGGPKRRLVHFSDTSSFKLVRNDFASDCPDCESDQSTSSLDTSGQAESYPSIIRVQDAFACLSHDGTPTNTDSDCRFPEFSHKKIPQKYQAQQFPIRTKLQDGPGSVTLATYTLVCMMVKQGSIEPKQVIDIVRHFSSSTAAPSCNPTPKPHEAFQIAEAGEFSHTSSHLKLHEHQMLCAGIQSRLAALRERIHTCGKAVLRPSNAIMGQPFAPALDFLRGVVRDVAAFDTQAEDSIVRKRPRADEA
mmetsp:Transcript_31528/g.65964  ORF Transcript_31528/g.65964 Transcript_31528/m.65964 type:complete len:254 (-) Transcript_31528:67-828(-)